MNAAANVADTVYFITYEDGAPNEPRNFVVCFFLLFVLDDVIITLLCFAV